MKQHYITLFCRLVLGTLFIFSGFVKAIDPMGVAYKIEEYLVNFGLEFLTSLSAVFSVFLCGAELFIGILLLCGVWRKVVAVATLLFMFVFTLITLYLAFGAQVTVEECGCFGDFIHLTNIETFGKNVLFLAITIYYAWSLFKKQGYSLNFCLGRKDIIIVTYSALLSFGIPIYSLIFLPPFDFMPFNVGDNIIANRAETLKRLESNETKLIYKSKQSGEIRKFLVSDTEWKDSNKWEYVDSESADVSLTQAELLSNFSVMDTNYNDVTIPLFDKSNLLVLIVRDISLLESDDFKALSELHTRYSDSNVEVTLFTSSNLEELQELLDLNGLSNISVYSVDDIVLKSMLRADKGVITIKEGTIIGKWKTPNYLKGDYYDKRNNCDLRKTLFLVVILIFAIFLVVLNLKKRGGGVF